jgi:hypothetical protein
MPISVAVDSQRVDGEDLIASREQRLHQKTSVGLDSDHDCIRFFGLVGDEGVDATHAFQAVRHPSPTEHSALLIQQADVVMLLRPVDTQKDHGSS